MLRWNCGTMEKGCISCREHDYLFSKVERRSMCKIHTLDSLIEKIVTRCREYLELDPALLGEPASYDGL